jgi:hypothetical protein
MGHSSAGQLVALLSAAPEHAYALGARRWLASVVLDSAVMDVVTAMLERHGKMYDIVFGNDPARWQRASPLHALSADAVPMLAVCSIPRSDNPCEQARLFAKRAAEVGASVVTLPEDLSHDDIYLDLGAANPYTSRVERFMTESMSR